MESFQERRLAAAGRRTKRAVPRVRSRAHAAAQAPAPSSMFASKRAEELASEGGLSPEALAPFPPSGATGQYTAADVRRALQDLG